MMPDDVSKILSRMRQYFNSGLTRPVSFRIEQLKNLKKTIRSHEDEIIQALRMDMKKPPFESYASEIGFLYLEIEYAIRHVRSWARPKRVSTPVIHFLSSSMVHQEPYGVALIIGPWNYPLQLVIAPLIGAMAAGNCALIKPSELAPATSSVIKRIAEAQFNPDYIKVIEGGIDVTQDLLTEKFDYIFYTGGTAVGRIIMEAAAKHLTPVTLELGGKSPCIVDQETNLHYTVKRIAWGKFFNAGQTCIAPDYCLVHAAIKEAFLKEMIRTLLSFYGEDPSRSPDYARIINEKHFQRLERLLNDGEKVFGGRRDRTTLYMAPTLIDRVTLEDNIMKEEIFGPLLPVMSYDHLDDAITIVNSLPRPLALYYFSDNKAHQQKALSEMTSGGGCINDTVSHIGSQTMPFGGVGNSGMGAYHGRYSFDTFSHPRGILKRSNLFDMALRYPPYKNNVKILKWLFRIIG
ncbi:MAG: aldehyde dehydrogenase family protein [Deltaproteobacteria bacterium HGW-Deltaproteobacteria-13]|nr:MAG: aldehyde dehydrogenase family protein [Deltaproteobacteria bacterium HGW-Deltaproteobacteria-13]